MTVHAPGGEETVPPGDSDSLASFKEFAGHRGDYYGQTFLRIQQAKLPALHLKHVCFAGGLSMGCPARKLAPVLDRLCHRHGCSGQFGAGPQV